MEWYIYLIIGYIAGFVSPIAALMIYGRKQIREELAKYKTK